MDKEFDIRLDDSWILSRRGRKNKVDQHRPYAWMVEKERTDKGIIEDTGIIFLTNRECSYHCLMCDLWKNTTDNPVPAGAIPEQIEWAMLHMPEVKQVKLYNSGSFFDAGAIPPEDYDTIASQLCNLETVIVESHPRLINDRCLQFRDKLKPQLQVAIGLETVHPAILRKLNKRMTTGDFLNAVHFLSENEILSRAFILLKPPFLSEEEGVIWAERSIDFAFQAGVECCTVIPVRDGNGSMEFLQEMGFYGPPDIGSLETVLEYGISLKAGRVFADVWDIKRFAKCDQCINERTKRLIEMNLQQQVTERVACACS